MRAVLPANSDIIYPGWVDTSFFLSQGRVGELKDSASTQGGVEGGVGRRRLLLSKNTSDAEKIQGFQAADSKSKIGYRET